MCTGNIRFFYLTSPFGTCAVQINWTEGSRGTHIFYWVITSHGFAMSWEKKAPRWISISTKPINHHHRVSLFPIPLFSSSTPTHILSFLSLFLIFYSPTLSPHALFFLRRVGFPLPFCFSSFFRFMICLEAGETHRTVVIHTQAAM